LIKLLLKNFKDAAFSILPISAAVLLLCFVFLPGQIAVILATALPGIVLLIAGTAFFTLGSDMANMKIGEHIGSFLSSSKKTLLILVSFFVIGTAITIAEPDLSVLSALVTTVSPITLILSIAVGVGVFLAVAALRTLYGVSLAKLLLPLYAALFILMAFVPREYLPLSFDSGGVTTGPVTVPFILALGVGISRVRGGKSSAEDSFGFVSIASIGPIVAVALLGIFGHGSADATASASEELYVSVGAAFAAFGETALHNLKNVAVALSPVAAIFVVFQIFALKLKPLRVIGIFAGFLITYFGLVLFLTGAEGAFVPLGASLGHNIASSNAAFLIVPFGLLFGLLTVLSEPSIHVLIKEVESVSNGRITRKSVLMALALAVAFSVALAQVRVLTGIPILPILLIGYGVALLLSFFVNPIYTSIAFDSGGVASGPMTSAFILSFTLGSASALGSNVYTDAFGVVALVAMTPLITIQVLGLYSDRAELPARLRGMLVRARGRVLKPQPVFLNQTEVISLNWQLAFEGGGV
jgi:hypothetical protein